MPSPSPFILSLVAFHYFKDMVRLCLDNSILCVIVLASSSDVVGEDIGMSPNDFFKLFLVLRELNC